MAVHTTRAEAYLKEEEILRAEAEEECRETLTDTILGAIGCGWLFSSDHIDDYQPECRDGKCVKVLNLDE